WFTGIGWVPFDPTPARSPAQSQSSALATSAAAADAGEVKLTRQGAAAGEHTSSSGSSGGDQGGTSWVLLAVILLLGAPLVLAAVMMGVRMARLRLLSPDELADVQLSELRRALVRLGWQLPASTTLLSLERRLGRLAGPSSQ